MFATSTTAFHLAMKPSLRLTLEEAAQKYGLLDLASVVTAFLGQECSADLKLQVWQKVRIQQAMYHDKSILDSPQTLCSISPTSTNLFGQYNSVIISSQHESNWPRCGLRGHSVAQIRIIFRVLLSSLFLAYVQHFHIIPQGNPMNTSAVTGMHLLKHAMRVDGQHIGEVIPLTQVRSPTHLVPHFSHEANLCLTKLNTYELSTEFWLNKYWMKEFYYALSPACI